MTAAAARRAKPRSIDPDEVARFDRIAARWWDPKGAFKPLHRLNPVRVDWIKAGLCRHFGRDPAADAPLKGLRILDVGCGGGLVTEALARLGAKVMGIDAAAEAIAVAKAHAKAAGLKIDYRLGAIEELDAGPFDAVTALEIVEHVADLEAFVAALAGRVRPGGALALSTLNRTARSFVLGIVVAEYVAGLVPRGTHDWKKFVRPSELGALLRRAGCETEAAQGIVLDPLTGGFRLSRDLGVNYLLFATKPGGS
ncbi:MAG: bifunctional 2-polyprenyl-6-hydroxyphenol methylase/3-demethylubiquinol 3-O-methyltransferase UbiG [Alphaproteobacteria bacterium]|nr:bifunctional 2-polyprenyl-6-hydroxyphenol methylase/3-demethylubiquinol 3-O-methyltransferase UbiG [Alphaproteobacteria bacterium]